MATPNDGHTEMAERFRQVIKDQFGTQIALARAIGVKDGSYLTPYVTGRSMIGGILRKKLEGVGIDVDYIMTGRKQELLLGEDGQDDSDSNDVICEQCASKLMDIQSKLVELNAAVLEVNKMVAHLKKSLR
ncbi:helix-turn-helix transcriptional regulator [Chlorobium sp. N1]|uniref:helix-turn-helix transcriptional regulator n=1 Tax=Chlorobium sp. N1 TaxID=2491138 RepID=UPI0010389DB7|nr:helix-turn-helix transcriptional regulator [Chlorobium sp. N1]TCD47199.1 XRE family transcriptional regulator [Chlorobium sp. N1]